MKSYAYAHRSGVRGLTWIDFASLAARLAEQLELFHPQAIVGIARAGLFPATAVACSLRRELFPARLTRRSNDEVVYDTPTWKVPISPQVAGKVIAIIDEMADSGQTLALAAAEARALGATQVITASLVSHSWANPAPDLAALVTDEFIIFPWDHRVRVEGTWQPHPEVVAGLAAQSQAATVHGRPAALRVLEVRRHTLRTRPSQHISQAGVELARQVGSETGPFDRVVTSTVLRAYETALAMGFAVDEERPEFRSLGEGVEDEVAWNAGFAAFAQALQSGGAVARFARTQAQIWHSIAAALPEGGRALLITHGGIVEAGSVACLPHADHRTWGAACECCEGVRLYFDGQAFIQAETLRLGGALPGVNML